VNQTGDNSHPAHDRSDESGAVLVLFALLVFGVFGMLGAVVDGGRLRVTKQQMDAGAECAALEGLRFKDAEGDVGRRARAILATQYLYDDDLNPSNGDAIGLGAGSLPVVLGDAPLGGDIDVALPVAARVWKPAADLEANLDNAQHGDLVAGLHVPLAPPSEDDQFDRADFQPVAAGSGPAPLAAAPAFLVRLRRASERLALDRQPGESSAGPPFEWLWARGSAWQEPVAGDPNASRADGLTVRAAAIASAERALLVSADPTTDTAVAAFALRVDGASAWQSTASGATLTLAVEPSGQLLVAGVEQGVVLRNDASAVGDLVEPAIGGLANAQDQPLLVPVYGTFDGVRRAVGFTRGLAALSGATLTITRLPAAVLPAGASTTSSAALDARIVLESNPAMRALHATFSEPVLAPVLRR